MIGSIAALCYFCSRVPQFLKNYYRKSCDGLSIATFYIIFSANLTYGLSVLFESTGWLYALRHLPWLMGSFGSCFFDIAMITQYYYYKKKNINVNSEQEYSNLLNNEDE